MPTLDALVSAITERWKPRQVPSERNRTQCSCGRAVSFDADRCPECGGALGFVPDLREFVSLEPFPGSSRDEDCFVAPQEPAMPLLRCAHFKLAARCNWMRRAEEAGELCLSCSLNVELPDLEDEQNARDWAAIEVAKRRLVAQLLVLGLPVVSRRDDPEAGLGFILRRPEPGGPPVLTGHASGLITLNIEEADDVRRAQIRRDLHEPYRTLLGHFRHEIGHYYWDRLIDGTRWLDPFRDLFGDERIDYSEALKRNYTTGPPPGWKELHISAYASAHPWEDWAETWAHYLHVLDSLTTAMAHGVDARTIETTRTPFTTDDLYDPQHPRTGTFLLFLNAWVEMIAIINELSRSLGQPETYPFELSGLVVRKLHFVHLVVEDALQNVGATSTEDLSQ